MNRELSNEPSRHGSPAARYSEGAIVASGAVVGAAVAFLLLTPAGRRLCGAIVDALDTFSSEWSRLCHATTRARKAAEGGWEALDVGTRSASRPRM